MFGCHIPLSMPTVSSDCHIELPNDTDMNFHYASNPPEALRRMILEHLFTIAGMVTYGVASNS
jgi:hypothetical protein